MEALSANFVDKILRTLLETNIGARKTGGVFFLPGWQSANEASKPVRLSFDPAMAIAFALPSGSRI